MALSGVLSFFTFFTFFSIAFAFTHPGLLVTDQDLSRAKQKIANQQDPWLSSWNKLTSLTYSSADYTNNAVSTVSRINLDSDVSNADLLWHDAAAAFNLAIRWKISGDDSYAATAAAILTAWGDKLERLGGGDEAYLLAGLQGYEMANAGELLRDYAPFQKAGLSTFTTMMTTVFLPMNIDFLNHVLGSEHNVKHFFANWELANVASAMAIAVLADNQTAWDFAVDYFKTGSGNGAINNAVTNVVEEPDTGRPLGQGQESGRDQGHSALDFQLLGAIGQQAWNQGEDLFAYNQSRLLLGAEYFARYNMGHDVPFEPYTNGIVSYTDISSASRGAIRPAWELLYNHYVKIKGQEAPWTTAYLNNSLEYFGGYEGGAGSWGEGSGHYDGLGWGSLLYHLDDSDLAVSSTSTPTTPTATSSYSSQTSLSSLSTIIQSASITTTSLSTLPSVASRTGPLSRSPSATSLPENTTLVKVVSSSSPFASFSPSSSSISKAATPTPKATDGPSCGAVRPHGHHPHRHN